MSHDVNHTEDQSVLGPHRDVTSFGVSADRGLCRSNRQKFVHLADASNLFTRGVDGEDEDKDDREEHSGVGTVHKKVRSLRLSCGKYRAVLVTEEGGSHTTDDDVDSHTDRNQETGCDRVHSREVGNGRGTAQDEHGRDDDVRGQSNIHIKHPLKVELKEAPFPKKNSPEEEENEVSKFSPTNANDLEPGVSMWGIELKLGGELMGSPQVRVSFRTWLYLEEWS